MARKGVEVTTVGTVEWARVYEHNRDKTGYNNQWIPNDGGYSVVQILSKDEMNKLKESGSSKKAKTDRLMDGQIAVTFTRTHNTYNKKGELQPRASGAPVVVDANDQPFTEIIGNGSLAEITNYVSFFPLRDGGEGSRTTLTKIKVLEHVPYIVEEDVA